MARASRVPRPAHSGNPPQRASNRTSGARHAQPGHHVARRCPRSQVLSSCLSALPRGGHVWSWGAAAFVIPSVTSPWDNSPHRCHLSAEWCKPGQKPRSRPLRSASSAWQGAPLLLESRSGVTNGSWKLGLGGRQPGTGQVQCPGTLKTMRQPGPL